jgi:CheY-like chemotaxis protein
VHCLVVDDSPLNQEVVERALRREGARATLVADGQQALDRLRAQPQDVDAVLMDIQMPVMDGLTATRAIRQELGLTELPVIAFSAGVLAEQRQQAREAGVSDFLAKPVDLDELVAVLHRWTDPQPAVAPVAERSSPHSGANAVGISRHPWHRSSAGGAPARPGLVILPASGASVCRRFRRRNPADATGSGARRCRLPPADGCIPCAASPGTLAPWNWRRARSCWRPRSPTRGRTRRPRWRTSIRACARCSARCALAGRRGIGAGRRPDAPLDEARLSALREALSGHDLAALDLFEALQPALARRDGQAATQALAQLIQSLRFTEALARLTQTDQAEPRDAHDGRPVG